MPILRDKNGRFVKGNTYWLGKVGEKKANSGSFKKGIEPWNKGKRTYKVCAQCGKKFPTNKGKLTRPHQKYCNSKCVGLSQRGKNHGKKIYKLTEYQKWRKLVLKRDGNRCIWCGSTENLNVDHIKQKSLFPELAFEINNGRTLCLDCHKKTKTYGVHK